MSKLGMKEIFLGAALALPSASVDAKPNPAAEAILRTHCTGIAEVARVATRDALHALEFSTDSMASTPDYAAEKAEKACLKEMGVIEPKASDTKK
ncbi:hypothetical protein HYW82_02960 [Candidatus Peregrinibacteria bacterium]|nr:hypothetical protein [Candidatus Peregrinibacteria bacterium]